jgi:hypothetical protein
MNIHQFFKVTVLIALLVTLITLAGIPSSLYGEPAGAVGTVNTALIPGDIAQICAYTDFFYNYPADDFFYHLNDRLLFTDKPDGNLVSSGLRNKLLKIIRWHKIIKRSLDRFKTSDTSKSGMITLNVTIPDEYQKAGVLMNLLGLRLEKNPEGKFHIAPDPASSITNYFGFAMIDLRALESQLNKPKLFHFKLTESEVPVPWDFAFLNEVTGLKVNHENFFELLLKDETFSLFLGVLFRLSHKEIDYIAGLVTSPPLGAWKRIYRDRQFLMGMFTLSGALRVNDSGLELPGGNDAEPFWTHLSGKNPHTAPLAFLYRLATKDDGKLNYLYLFSYFLPVSHQIALFTGRDAQKMVDFYEDITLKGDEKILAGRFPRIGDVNAFTLLYALRMEGRRFNFPAGLDAWLQTLRDKDSIYRVKLLEEGKSTPDGFGVLDSLKDIVILLPGGERIKGTIESREDEKLVVVATLPKKKNETGGSTTAVFKRTGEEEQEMSVTETPELNSPEVKEKPDTGGIMDPLDTGNSIEIKKDGEYTGGRSFFRKFAGKFWPRRWFFIKMNCSFLQPRDSNFKNIYGNQFFYPEVKVGLQFTENLSFWIRRGAIRGEADVSLLQETAVSQQSFSACGFGYTFRISERLHTDFDIGFVKISYKEESMDEFIKASALGFRFDGALSFHLSKWLFTDVSLSYMSANKGLDDLTLKLGGLGAGVGIGIKF